MQDTFQQRIFDRLATLPNGARRVKFVSRLRLLSASTVERLDEAVRQLVRTDLKKAQELADAAIAIADALGNKEAQAFALRAQANALWFHGQYSRASEMNAQAIELFHELRNSLEEGRTLSTSIQPLILLGEYDRAQAAAARAQTIFSAAGDTVRLARLDINVGNIFHRQDRFSEALDHYQRAYSQLLPDKDDEGVIAALHNVAVCQITLNEKDKALEAYRQVHEFCRGKNMPLAMAQAEYNIAYLYFLSGEYGRAIELLRATYQASQLVGDSYHCALCRLDLSEIYLQLNLNQEAAELAEEAYNRFEQLGMGYEAAKALCQFAIALSQQRKNFRALMLFAQARSLFVAEKNYVWPSLIDLYEAFAHFNDGRYAEARLYCSSALRFFSGSILPGRAVVCHLLLARLSLKAGDVAGARKECQTALASLTGRETMVLVYEAHLVMGQIEEIECNLQKAESHYLTAKEMLESLRSGIRGEELKISFLENKLEVYENLVWLCLERNPSFEGRKQAWSFMEQAKSRNLLEMIVRGANSVASDTSSQSQALPRILKLREQMNWYYHRIEVEQMALAPAGNDRLLHLRSHAEQHEKEFLRALRELPPDEAESVGLEEAKPVSLELTREILGTQATLIEYFRVRDQILATVITGNDLEIVSVTTVPRLSAILGMLQQQFSQFGLSAAHVEQFAKQLFSTTQESLHRLYLELIGPIRDVIKGQHLVIVPHESLHSVPFHALFDGSNYLIDLFTVSQAPSASIYVQCCRKRANHNGVPLILGVATQQTPCVDDELKSLATIFPDAKLFFGPDATEMVLRQNGPTSRLIHIATHGVFRQDQPMFSGICLGDTFLSLYDLYSLKLPASHVTLSGCSTGLNAVASGDEIIGLARGLLSAGARSLLLSLWDVNDKSTAEFMKVFYGSFVQGQNAALALQNAMQAIRRIHPHPYYWAPFTLMGGTSL